MKTKIKELYKNKKILITGGTGFLGKNMVSYLKDIDVECVFPVGSSHYTNHAGLLYRHCSRNKYDYIFHLATFQGAGTFPLKYPADQFKINNEIHTNTFDMWKKYQPQAKMVGIGSTCSYPVKSVLKEEDFMTGPLHTSVNIYGLTKINMVQGISAYKRQYNLKGTTVVLATLYGPHDTFDLEKAHVVSALVRKFCDAVKNNEQVVEVWGTGEASRELIYVKDQVEGILIGAQSDDDLINVGKGEETTIKDLAEEIKYLSGFDGEIFFNPDRFVGVRRKVLDISKAKKEFGWNGGETLLRDGLKQTIEWYKNNEQIIQNK